MSFSSLPPHSSKPFRWHLVQSVQVQCSGCLPRGDGWMGWKGWRGTGSRCNADTSQERVPCGLGFFLLISLTQDMNCKMSNYLMKIHPRLAKYGRRLGMSLPRGTKPTSPRLVAIRTINAHYVPNEPWMTCLLFRVLAHRQASVCSSSSVLAYVRHNAKVLGCPWSPYKKSSYMSSSQAPPRACRTWRPHSTCLRRWESTTSTTLPPF